MMLSSRHATGQQRLRVTIIGAGISGLLIAYKLREHLSEYVEFVIYEKSPDLGGTWYENRYPGCACDVPSHVYQYSFAPNPEWSKFYASSNEIHRYLKRFARVFGLDQSIQFNSKVTSAVWCDADSYWAITLEDGRQTRSQLLINAGGILNHPQTPDIKGLSSFAGPVLHTAAWNTDISLRGQRVGVIGAGASAIQLLPNIQSSAAHVDVFIRTPSWITPPVALGDSSSRNPLYTEKEKVGFRGNTKEYLSLRKELDSHFNSMFRAFFKASPEQAALREQLDCRMRELIVDKDLQAKLIPTFDVGCRRINPGEQYLEALQEENVTPVFEPIQEITATGVSTSDGVEYAADVLVLATGFNTTFRPRFPILGRGGINLQDLWAEKSVSYMGTGVSGFPNYLTFLGPNTPISNGSLIGVIEATGDYFIRLIRKMIRQDIQSFDVRSEVQLDFDKHTQEFMKGMVWTGTCRSWCKSGNPLKFMAAYEVFQVKQGDGRVNALWPGSSLHYIQTLAEDRWEDYSWQYRKGTFNYWGSGISWIEDPSVDQLGADESESRDNMPTIPHKGGDLSYYIQECPPLTGYETDAGERVDVTVPKPSAPSGQIPSASVEPIAVSA